MFFKKATKFNEIFTVDLTLCSKCQIDGEDFTNFCGLLKKHEIYCKWLIDFSVLIRLKLIPLKKCPELERIRFDKKTTVKQSSLHKKEEVSVKIIFQYFLTGYQYMVSTKKRQNTL